MTMKFFKEKLKHPKKIGLALGSGSARGWAHIGVIHALTEAGIPVDYVAGTSIGAVVGAVYAVGRIDSLEEMALQFDWKMIIRFLDVVFPKSGLIDGKKVADFIREHVEGKNIENFTLPFCTVSTDLATGCEVVIKEGDSIEAVRASISVPGVFTPVRRNSSVLVDGGLVNPVPVSVVRQMGADFVIAVDLNHDVVGKKGIGKKSGSSSNTFEPDTGTEEFPQKGNKIMDILNKKIGTLDFPALAHIRQWMSKDPLPNIFEVIMSSINIMETQITTTRMKTDLPDLLIQPNLGHIRFLEFNRAQEAILEGYREMKAHAGLLPGKGG